MKGKFIKTSITEYITESNIELFKSIPLNRNIRGGFLNKEQSNKLQKEIESNYINGDLSNHFNRTKQDIRMNLFNYDNPISEIDINGTNLRITQGLIRNNEKTYLLYVNGEIIGEFYSISDIKEIIKYIQSKLIKNIN